MDNTDNKDDAFPPEYAYIGEMVKDAEERIRLIDEQIKNIPKDQGPSLQYNPPGFLQSRQMGSRDLEVSRLEQVKSQIRDDLLKTVEKETFGADPKTATTVRDATLKHVYRNPFEGKSLAELRALKEQSKDLETSQNYADALRKTGPTASLKSEPEREEKSPTNLPQFLQSFDERADVEKSDAFPNKDIEVQKDIDDPDMG